MDAESRNNMRALLDGIILAGGSSLGVLGVVFLIGVFKTW